MSYTVRMSVLGVLLAVALGGLAYEYLVAIPGFKNAQDKLTELSDKNLTTAARVEIKDDNGKVTGYKETGMTRTDVKEVVSMTPSKVEVIKPLEKKEGMEADGRGVLFWRYDTYNFYHALPWKTPNRIIVSYKRVLQSEEELAQNAEEFADNEWLFSTVYYNEDPPPPPKMIPQEVSDEWDFLPMGGGPPGGGGQKGKGGPKGKGKGGGAKKGSRPSIDSMFNDNDKNKDGKLSGDEIPEAMKSTLNRIDSNKDGAISLDEMKAASEKGGGVGRGGMRPQSRSGVPPQTKTDKKSKVEEKKATADKGEKADEKK